MKHSSLSRRAFLATGSTIALHVGAATLAACESSSTTGDRVMYETTATGDVAGGEAFVTSMGWTVSLDEAWIAIGYVRFVEGSPLAMRPARRRRPGRAADWLVRAAHAHPGHYTEGLAIGEVLTPQLVHLLDGTQSLGEELGVSGDARSAVLRFEDGDGVDVPRPGVVAFVAGLAGDTTPLVPGDPPHNAFLRGVQKAAGYPFRYQKHEPTVRSGPRSSRRSTCRYRRCVDGSRSERASSSQRS
ncbi:MAG: hypothetical protein RIF41_22110 [Polyangiaceae bacterium]